MEKSYLQCHTLLFSRSITLNYGMHQPLVSVYEEAFILVNACVSEDGMASRDDTHTCPRAHTRKRAPRTHTRTHTYTYTHPYPHETKNQGNQQKKKQMQKKK